MRTEIIYFSGTGNTLLLAQDLNQALNTGSDSSTLAAIADVARDEPVTSSADRVLLAFPVYFVDFPEPVRAFLSRLAVSPGTKVYTLGNCGANDWGVLASARRQLAAKDLELAGHFRFVMPDNSIVFPTEKGVQDELVATAKAGIGEVARIILAGESRFDDGSAPFARVVTPVMRWVCRSALGFTDMKVDAQKCTGCGVCVSVCPMNVISKEGQKPEWTDRKNCATCFACIHYCPSKAVRFRKQKPGDDYQYRNPHIPLSEMTRR